jgi:hypothetical protein
LIRTGAAEATSLEGADYFGASPDRGMCIGFGRQFVKLGASFESEDSRVSDPRHQSARVHRNLRMCHAIIRLGSVESKSRKIFDPAKGG